MTVLGTLADEVGVDERTLRRAVDQGTIRARRPSPRKLELPLSEPGYIRRAWPLLSALRGALRTESNVRLAVLFGSTATGDDTRDSDVDLLVALRDASFERTLDLSAKLESIVWREVDVVLLDEARSRPSLVAEISATGRVLVDRDHAWPLSLPAHTDDDDRAAAALAGIDRLLAR